MWFFVKNGARESNAIDFGYISIAHIEIPHINKGNTDIQNQYSARARNMV